MKVTYLYHSGFTVEVEDIALVFDYYKGELPETVKGKKLYVFSSHYHKDHFQYKVFDWAEEYDVTYLLSKDIRARGPEGKTIKVKKRQELKVDDLWIKTLCSTDVGVAFFVRVRGTCIYHAGDLNWWHWEEEDKAWNNNMAYPHIHMIFIQVSGKGQDAVIGLCRQFLVLFRVDMLNVQHY